MIGQFYFELTDKLRAEKGDVVGSSPWPDQHSGSLNNWGECTAFAMTSANG